MTLVLETPVKLRLIGYDNQVEELSRHLTYTDKSIEFEIQRLKKSPWLKQKIGTESFNEKIQDLQAEKTKSLLFTDDQGLWTYSGFATRLSRLYNEPITKLFTYPEAKNIPYSNVPTKTPRPYQVLAHGKLLASKHGGIEQGCHRKGEKVLLSSGRLKKVEEVIVGDTLMGPDSTPRKVLELKRGVDSMYEIETINGQIMTVNGGHILSLRRTNRHPKQPAGTKRRKDYRGENPIITITVEDYLNQSKKFKHLYKLYSVPVEFESKTQPKLDPYILGLNLQGKGSGSKFIPYEYKTGSKETRLQILAGLMDTDGSLTGGCYDYISKSKQLAEDVCFVSRSLGLRATIAKCRKGCQTGAVGTYFRVTISGDISIVPVKLPRKMAAKRKQIKNPTSFGFKVAKVADQEEHYGFALDGDHLYLTDTFLVTHNTGTGKTLEQIMLLKSLGLKSLLMTPSLNIAEQTYEQMVSLFGKKYVGTFFGGKKQSDKLFVIGVAQSLTKIEPNSEHYNNISNTQVFIADESHQCPAKTLAKVCFDLVGNAPYRFFFSGTQTRTDGSDLLLEGITGDIVFTMTVQEGVDQGYLAKPIFRMIKVNSNQYCNSDDANVMTRKHVYYNPQVLQIAADFTNKAVVKLNRPTLILIDEFAQFTKLLPYLRVEARFAHGGVSKDNQDKIAEKFHESNPKQLVEDFNAGKFPVLVGTSCISTGTDIQAAQAIVYLKGGKSEIEVKQAIGRGTRLYPGKKDCMVFDFEITNVPTLQRHAKARKKIYKDIYPDYAEIKI